MEALKLQCDVTLPIRSDPAGSDVRKQERQALSGRQTVVSRRFYPGVRIAACVMLSVLGGSSTEAQNGVPGDSPPISSPGRFGLGQPGFGQPSINPHVIESLPRGEDPFPEAPVVVSPKSRGTAFAAPLSTDLRSANPDFKSMAKAKRSDLETLVSITSDLQTLLEEGGEPSDLEHLRALERQVQKVAQQADKCTVSVQIGPAQGCGVIITESGYLLTAAHVAMRPKKLARVTLSDGRRVLARTLGMNRRVDAGLMKIEPNQNGGRPWPHASLGNSSKVRSGMWCIATGHPGGYDPARGSVARVGRILSARPGAIETDCALIGGDSGGPLFDIAGRLVAVHSRIGNDVTENLHVPIDYYGKSWDRMRAGEAYGFLPGFRPVLGLQGKTKALRATITIVKKGSPAEDAGVQVGDTIEQFGDVTISNFESLRKAVSQTMPGERVPILVVRKSGKRTRLVVEIGRAD